MTKPIPREELAPVSSEDAATEYDDTRPALAEAEALARATDGDAPTMVPCPICRQGHVSPEIASTLEGLMRAEKGGL